jgi:hypothetical protein
LIDIFDVRFVDGTCISLFTGCDNNVDDLTFRNSGTGGDATSSLLNFLGDTNQPNSILGCESTTDCFITIPININLAGNNVSGSTLWLIAGLTNDLPITESSAAQRDQDLLFVANRTYAIFSLSDVGIPSEVPIPGALPFMISGLAGLGFMGRKKRKHNA